MLMNKPIYRHRFFRLFPPIVDTFLLGSGITLMIMSVQYPTTDSWLLVKLIALVIYIFLGTVALKRSNNIKIQRLSFLGAITTILFIASVAMAHHPLGFFLLFFE